MKPLYALFLISVLMSLGAFAQTEVKSKQTEISKAVKVDEFGYVPNGQLRQSMDMFLVELHNNATVQGYIINYGKMREITAREKLFRNHINFRGFDLQRVKFVTGGYNKEIKTELWIVPQGAEPPKPVPTAKIFAEIGTATNQKFKKLMEEFYIALREPVATGYIINYGKASEVTRREKQIRNSITFRRYDADRIVIVNGGKSKALKTVFWIVPQGAEPPTP